METGAAENDVVYSTELPIHLTRNGNEERAKQGRKLIDYPPLKE